MSVEVAGVTFRRWKSSFGVIEDGCVVMREVPAVNVVDESVSVVVDAVAGDFTRIDPDVVVQVFVIDVETRVDNADDNAAVAGRDVPRLLRANIVAWSSGVSEFS